MLNYIFWIFIFSLFSAVAVFCIAYTYACCCDCCDSQCPPGLQLNTTRRRRAIEEKVKVEQLFEVPARVRRDQKEQTQEQTQDRERTPQVDLIKSVNPMGVRRKPQNPVMVTLSNNTGIELNTEASKL